MATRRDFLAGGLALGLIGERAAAQTPAGLLGAGQADGKPCGVLWREQEVRRFDIPARGHAIARLGEERAVIVGRRPGGFAAIIDLAAGGVAETFAPGDGARFSGHGAVAPHGRSLVTAEFDAETIQGRISLRDAKSGAIRAVWPAGGIEPHELGFAKGGSRLVAALGGLVHDGGVAGPAVNPDGVKSALVELDASSGRLLRRHELGEACRSLSMRHLAFAPDGRVVVGMQDQDLGKPRPLIGLLEPGRGVELLAMPDPVEIDFRGYVGSVAVDAGGAFLAATSPRGGVVGLWSMADGRWLGGLHLPDVCGLAPGAAGGEFWVTSGFGDVVRLKASSAGLAMLERSRVPLGFDNHLLRL